MLAGTVVGCLRRIRGWSLSSALHEYLFYAAPKTRLEDQRMIESFAYTSSNEEFYNCLIRFPDFNECPPSRPTKERLWLMTGISSNTDMSVISEESSRSLTYSDPTDNTTPKF